jgi:hypothetical protein
MDCATTLTKFIHLFLFGLVVRSEDALGTRQLVGTIAEDGNLYKYIVEDNKDLIPPDGHEKGVLRISRIYVGPPFVGRRRGK